MASLGNPLRQIISPFQLMEAGGAGTMVSKFAGSGGASASAAGLALPQTATANLFTVKGGSVLVTSLIGIVTTAIGGTATNLSLGSAPTIGTAATAGIGGPSAITSAVAGTIISAPSTAGAGGTTLVAPGVPSSGTATTNLVTNNYHGTVDVTLSGFTLTAVFVNGVQVGTTNATYAVPQHGVISITYSVIGTWTWTGSVALGSSANGTVSIPKDTGFVVAPGTITWTTSGSTTGAIRWYLTYLPIDTLFGAGGPSGTVQSATVF